MTWYNANKNEYTETNIGQDITHTFYSYPTTSPFNEGAGVVVDINTNSIVIGNRLTNLTASSVAQKMLLRVVQNSNGAIYFPKTENAANYIGLFQNINLIQPNGTKRKIYFVNDNIEYIQNMFLNATNYEIHFLHTMDGEIDIFDAGISYDIDVEYDL